MADDLEPKPAVRHRSLDDDVLLIEDSASRQLPLDFYLILIVDDDLDVHQTTRVALHDVIINGKRLLFMDAFSGAEAMVMIRRGIPFDLILLDMVMESADAGMSVAKQLQVHYGMTKAPAVIMRTGQPGHFRDQNVNDSIWFENFMVKSYVTQQSLLDLVTRSLNRSPDEGVTLL